MSLPNVPTPNVPTPDAPDAPTPEDTEELGSLTVEDDPEGTIDPAELAGTADEDDADVR